MFISKITYNLPDAYDYLNSNLTSYSMHQDMWNFFPGMKDKKKGPFLFSVQRDKVLMVSSVKPVVPNSLWSLQTRSYDPIMDKEQELFYELTFCPSYAKDGKKCSYITNNLKEGQGTRQEQVEILLKEWFKARMDRLGFEIVSLEVIRDFVRVIPKPGEEYKFNELSTQGVLKVTDVNKLRQTVFDGIGRNKRNGCGLLLLS